MSTSKPHIEIRATRNGPSYAYSAELGMALARRGKTGVLIVGKPSVIIAEKEASFPWCPWGENDSHPQDVLKDVKPSTIIPSKLDEKARMLYAAGVHCGYTTVDDNGKETFHVVHHKDIEAWKRKTAFNRYLMDACKDMEWFNHVFPEIMMGEDKTALGIVTHAAEYCRYAWPNENTGRYDYVYVNKDRATKTASIENSVKIPCLDPYYDPVGFIKADNRKTNYIYPLSYSVPGCEHYQIPEWDAVRKSLWLKYSLDIPDFKSKFMDNQIAVKYLVEIADWYWQWKYPDFDKNEAKRGEYMQETFDEINDMLTGTQAAGKTILTTFMYDKRTGGEMKGIKITAIDNKFKDGQYLDDGKMANEHLLYALNFDPALAGQTPGSERGSGSDIRVAYNKYISHILPKAELILEPMNIISELNGWNEKYAKGNILEWRFKQTMIATLDSGSQMKPVLPSKSESNAV
jgi:hypothetical protein